MPDPHPLDVRGLDVRGLEEERLGEERLGDWLLRAGGGFSGRAGSALAALTAPLQPRPAPESRSTSPPRPTPPGWPVITAGTVAEDHRRRGPARAVMAAAATAGQERGAHSCLLQVSEDNAPASALYARLRLTGQHRHHYRSAPA
jgi:ribosomal protein S18 acetylase RimI-like enzyme